MRRIRTVMSGKSMRKPSRPKGRDGFLAIVFSAFFLDAEFQIFLDGGDTSKAKRIDEHLRHTGREESRQCGANMDIFHPETE